MEELSCFIYLLIQLFFYVIIDLRHYLFRYSTCSIFGCWKVLEVGFFWHAPILSRALPYFLALQDAPGSSIFFCLTFEINYVYKEFRFLLLENGMRNKDLSSRDVCYDRDVIDSKLHQCFYWYSAVLINVVFYWVLKLCSVSVPTLFLFKISLATLVPFLLHVKIYKTTCWDFHWVYIDQFEVNWHLNNIKSSTCLLFFFLQILTFL